MQEIQDKNHQKMEFFHLRNTPQKIVLIHDSARPLVSNKLIKKIIEIIR